MKYKSFQGFTLIEALVSLVILSAAFTVTWGWFNSAAKNTTSIERAVRLPLLFDEFIEHFRLVDLRTVRSGAFTIDGFLLTWQAKENRVSSAEFYRKQPKWLVTLFDIEVKVTKDGKPIADFTTQHVAQWQDPSYIENPFENM